MTKSELKQIIKGIIVESINEKRLSESTPEGFPDRKSTRLNSSHRT